MTVPQCHAKSETLDKKRDTLNSLITADERANVLVCPKLSFYFFYLSNLTLILLTRLYPLLSRE
jgi:hypothetical protein